MSIACVACTCGSSDRLVRGFLKDNNYPDWLGIPVVKGKDKSLSLIRTLPNFPERQAAAEYVQKSSKWALIIGYNDNGLRFADIAHYNAKNRIDAKHIIDTFS